MDFWSDKKFPLHQRGGIIFVDGKNASIAETDGFELLIVFLTSFGGGWKGRFRASSQRVYVKFAGADCRKVLYEVAPIRPLIYEREVTEESL